MNHNFLIILFYILATYLLEVNVTIYYYFSFSLMAIESPKNNFFFFLFFSF